MEVTTRAGQSTRRRDVFGGSEGLKYCGRLTVVAALDTEVDGVDL